MKLSLKAARVNQGLKQKEAAKILGISKEALCRYENNKSLPGIATLRKIEELYDIKYEDIKFF